MGWSCAMEAGKTMDAIGRGCREATGSSNVYVDGGKRYFCETSSREHRDGAITGSVMLMLTPNMDGGRCRKVGTFRIEPDGKISRGPAWMKKAAEEGKKIAPKVRTWTATPNW